MFPDAHPYYLPFLRTFDKEVKTYLPNLARLTLVVPNEKIASVERSSISGDKEYEISLQVLTETVPFRQPIGWEYGIPPCQRRNEINGEPRSKDKTWMFEYLDMYTYLAQ